MDAKEAMPLGLLLEAQQQDLGMALGEGSEGRDLGDYLGIWRGGLSRWRGSRWEGDLGGRRHWVMRVGIWRRRFNARSSASPRLPLGG